MICGSEDKNRGLLALVGDGNLVSPLEGKWQAGSGTLGACQLAGRPRIHALEVTKSRKVGRRKKMLTQLPQAAAISGASFVYWTLLDFALPVFLQQLLYLLQKWLSPLAMHSGVLRT